MTTYIHELPSWPKFTWDQHSLAGQLAAVRHRQGRLIGRMQALGFALREEAVLQTLTEDVLKSSEIEGEILDKTEVRSSIARRLGMEAAALPPADRDVEGVVEMMLDATQKFRDQLTQERLFGWHASLFPTGRSGLRKIIVGAWRDDRSGPMQVVSGIEGRERVHYEAPVAARVEAEIKSFLGWFNGKDDTDPVLKAALAHLWFVTIHPFDDGNGRIARAIADMSLARSEDSSQRFYSMSAQIRLERSTYYDMLESTQKGDLDATPWMEWFLGCLDRAFDGAETTLAIIFRKAEFWKRHSATPFNERQRDIVNRLLDGFEGNLTSSKWAIIEKCSADTALRDITDLLQRGLLRKNEGSGRSTSYSPAERPGEQARRTGTCRLLEIAHKSGARGVNSHDRQSISEEKDGTIMTTRPQLPDRAPREKGVPTALDGLLVVDFTRVVAGPACTQTLADFGAEVIKIENPDGGDDTRSYEHAEIGGESAAYLSLNRNKRGIALDFTNPAALEVARDLIAKADVVVENFSGGVMKKFGLDYVSVAPANPRLVYCSISAYGRKGPFALRPGFDPITQAESGFMSLNGFPDGQPVRTGPPVIDLATGMSACNAILLALLARDRLGRGQHVEVALIDIAVAMTGFFGMAYLINGVNPGRFGNSPNGSPSVGVYEASDGPFYIACANDRLYRRLVVEVLDRPDLITNPEFANRRARTANREKLRTIIGKIFAGDRLENWIAKMKKANIPVGYLRTVEEGLNAPEVRDRHRLSRIPHPTAGSVPNIETPLRMELTPVVDPVAAPLLGEHTRVVLAKTLGYDDARIDALAEAGAFGKVHDVTRDAAADSSEP